MPPKLSECSTLMNGERIDGILADGFTTFPRMYPSLIIGVL